MTLDQYPTKAFGFFIEEMDDESVIYRLGAHKAIHLNPTAAAIWKMSDGTRTVRDLIEFFKAEYPDAPADIASDVQDAVRILEQQGALLLVDKAKQDPA